MKYIYRLKTTWVLLENKARLFLYRREARHLRKKLVNKRGYTVLDRKKKKFIKSYAKKIFGSSFFVHGYYCLQKFGGIFTKGGYHMIIIKLTC